MPLPVYTELRQAAHPLLGGPGASANAGLVHEKFADSWDGAFRDQDDKARKRLLQHVAGLAATGTAQRLLKEYHSRRKAMGEKRGGRVWSRQSAWRLVAGMGRANPLEIGFNWDHRLGVPRLPGSSIKGAISSWARTCLDPPEQDAVQRIFGTQEQAGSVIVLDAYPVSAGKLDLDVMNVHYPSYYASPGTQAPTGMEGPNPLLFLAVPPGTEWVTWILPRTRGAGGDVALALQWLERCAAEWGLGAKTNVGYGYFAGGTPAGTAPAAPASQAIWRDETWRDCRLRRTIIKGAVQVQVEGGPVPLVIEQRLWQPIESGYTPEQKEALRRGELRATLYVQRQETSVRLVKVEVPDPEDNP